MTEKMLTILFVLSMLLSVLTGCGSGGAGSGSTVSGQSSVGSGGSTDKKTIGMMVKNTSTEYIQAFMIGAQEVCDKYGIEPKIVDGRADSLKIMDTIDTFTVQSIDGLILARAEDLITLVSGIKKLNEEGTPVFAIDICPEGGHVDVFTTNDTADSSRKAAAQIVQDIRDTNGGEVPKGVIIEITGSLVDMYTTECHEGPSSVMEQYPQLTVVQGEGHWNDDDPYSRTSDLLIRYSDDVPGIYAHTLDIMGPGVVVAVEAAGLDLADYFISGICIGVGGVHLLNEGKLCAAAEQPALDMITMAVEYINKMFNGEEIPKVGDTVTKEGALQSPARVINNEFADSGATTVLQSPLVSQEYQPSDERLYENHIG